MKFIERLRASLSRPIGRTETSTNLYPLLQEAQVHLQHKEYTDARSVLLKVMENRDKLEDPAVIDWVLRSLSSTWLFSEQYAEEIAFWSEYIKQYPSDSAAYSERAAAYWYSGDLAEAVSDYSRARKLRPTDTLSLSGRGQVFAETGENERALEDLHRALQALKVVPRLGPGQDRWYEEVEAFVRNGIGLALPGLGETEMSAEQFEMSLSISPENAWVYYNRAQVYAGAGDHNKASSDYRLALAKRGPALNPLRRERAQARFRDLANQA